MSIAQPTSKPTPTDERLPWGEICARYWDEWVFLQDVEDKPDGCLDSARVLDHDRSASALISRIDIESGGAVVNTAGRRLSEFRRYEVLDEIRDPVGPAR